MEKGWKKVYFTGEEINAVMARDLLAESGIIAVILDHHDSSYLSFGDVEVYVAEKDEEVAVQILANLKKG
jgi:hypothetical protein